MICDDDIFPTPSEICTEIQMHRKALSYNGAFIIVEGGYDSQLFSRFFENNCTLPIIACGKENVIEVFSLLNNTEKGYIGIVDADCDLINCLENS